MKWIGILMMIMNVSIQADIKAILFDCDGTLVDSEYGHYLGWKQALNDLGSDLEIDDYYQYVGKSAESNAQLIAKHKGIDSPDYLVKAKRQYYTDICKGGFPPIEATVVFVKALALEKEGLGIKMGVCSAAKKGDILSHLGHLQIDHLFDVILSGQDDLHEYSDPRGVNKPRPYVYLHAMKLLGVSPDETIVIEDSASGAWAGVTAGCFTIAVPNAFTKAHDFSHTHWQLDSFANISVAEFLSKITQIMQIIAF